MAGPWAMCKIDSPMRLAATLQLCFVLSAISDRARAQPSVPLDLEWSAPSECPDGPSVVRGVGERLGGTRDSTPTLQASGQIERSSAGFRLELQTEHGERRLEAASCDELARSAALILALLIDPQAEPSKPTTPIAPSPPLAPPPVAAQPPAAPQPKAAPIAVGGYARAELLLDVGMFPNVAVGPGIALGLTLAATSLELSAGFWPNNSLAYPDWVDDAAAADSLAKLSGFAVRFGACQRIARGPELGICMFGEYMNLTADPDDALEQPTEHSTAVWTLLAALRLGLPIGDTFGVVFELGAGVPLHGATYTVEPLGELHSTGDVVGRMRAGFELRF